MKDVGTLVFEQPSYNAFPLEDAPLIYLTIIFVCYLDMNCKKKVIIRR